MLSRFCVLLLSCQLGCAVNAVKRDLGPRNTLPTSAAFGLDAVAATALIASPKAAVTAIGYVYGGYAAFLYGVFMLLRPDTRWVTEDEIFETRDMRAKVELRKTGIAEFTFAEPVSPEELTLCRGRLQCSHGYGIDGTGWMPLDVSAWEPEGYSGSFQLKGDTLFWNRPPGMPLEFRKRSSK